MKNVSIIALSFAGLVQICPSPVKAETAYSVNRDSATFYLTLGKEDQAARKYANAWRYFEKAANYDGQNAEAQLAIADVCTKMNRMGPAIKALEAACRIRSADYATQWKLVQLYFNYGRYDKVIDILPGLRGHVADMKGWAYLMGKSYYANQNYGKAIEYLNASLKDDPKNSEASYLLGRIYAQMDNYNAAVQCYQRSLAVDGSSQPARTYEFALVLTTAGQYDASIEMFQKAIERGYKPRDDFYMNMALTMADAHKTVEAIDMMKDLLRRRPQDLGLLNGLADVCYHSGRYKEAINYWDKVLGNDDKNARVLYQIGSAYIKMGNKKDGTQLCDQAIAMDPSLSSLKVAHQMPF
jgi:tetratricopeptide (TPR) repeat protein